MPLTPVPSAAHTRLCASSTGRQSAPLDGPAKSPPCQSPAHHGGRETFPPRSSTAHFQSQTGAIHRSTLHLPSPCGRVHPARWPDVPPHHCVPTTCCYPWLTSLRAEDSIVPVPPDPEMLSTRTYIFIHFS